jgi:hypothetical protein
MQSMPMLYKESVWTVGSQSTSVKREGEGVCKHPVSRQLQKFVAQTGDSSETQRKLNVCHRKPPPSSAVKAVARNTSPFVTVSCKV